MGRDYGILDAPIVLLPDGFLASLFLVAFHFLCGLCVFFFVSVLPFPSLPSSLSPLWICDSLTLLLPFAPFYAMLCCFITG